MLSRSLLVAPLLLAANVAAEWTCPAAFSDGPCFTSAKTWMDAQKTCESHGSNLATLLSDEVSQQLAANGCFSDAPWNDWKCTWVGATDLKSEGNFEWASGKGAFDFHKWGKYEPSTVANNTEGCVSVCNGGSLEGYEGNFWLDMHCEEQEFAFCCDADTYVKDAGTETADSFSATLPAPAPPPAPVDTDPYDKRRMCFSTDMPWHDAQAICESIGTHLITIHNEEEMKHMGDTVHFSRVPDSWGLDWRCFWLGMHDRSEENGFEWISGKRPTFTPPFGPFEGANGDGAEQDCVAMCQADCDHKNSTECNDMAEYGYTGDFLIDAECNDEYGFCCEGLAKDYVANANNTKHSAEAQAIQAQEEVKSKNTVIIALGVLLGVTVVMLAYTVMSKRSSVPGDADGMQLTAMGK
jgi:hypothetical protein